LAKEGYCFGEFCHPETQSGCPVREHREASLKGGEGGFFRLDPMKAAVHALGKAAT